VMLDICLNHGIALAQSSPRTTKRHCGICTSSTRDVVGEAVEVVQMWVIPESF
jgi:hypothetical protein